MFKYIMRAAAIIFFLLGIAGTAVLIWFVYVAALRPSLERKWVQIPSPVEPLTTLKVGDAGEIFAEGEDGGLYQFSMYPERAWIKVKETEKVYTGVTCRPITDNIYKSESMSNKVKAHVSVDCGFAEQANYLDVDLLENGETWYFEKSSNSYVTLGLIVLLPIGLIIDAVLYVIGLSCLALEVIVTSRRKQKQTARQFGEFGWSSSRECATLSLSKRSWSGVSRPPLNKNTFNYWWFRYAPRFCSELLNHRGEFKHVWNIRLRY